MEKFMNLCKTLYVWATGLRFLPCWMICRNGSRCREDLARWHGILRGNEAVSFPAFADLMTFFPEYRSLVYARIKVRRSWLVRFLKLLGKPLPLLSIAAENIKGGLYIQHGFATIIAPRKIGRNCWINQGVTIGYTNAIDCPTLGDDITVGAGAKILGNCVIGDRVIVGANAVVVKDVPSDCTVVGVPAYIIRRNGKRVFEKL